jgi:hypothetical protein
VQLESGRPDETEPRADQKQADDERSGGLKTGMPVGVGFIGLGVGVVGGKQHDDVRHQIGQGVNAIGNQRLGAGP